MNETKQDNIKYIKKNAIIGKLLSHVRIKMLRDMMLQENIQLWDGQK